jgi:hypothetical protein
MNAQNPKKFFVAGAALVMVFGLSACHYGHGGRGYNGPSHGDAQYYDRERYDGGHYDRGYRRGYRR